MIDSCTKVRDAYYNALIHYYSTLDRDPFIDLIGFLRKGTKGWDNMGTADLRHEITDKYSDELVNEEVDVTKTKDVEDYFLKNFRDI